MACKRQRKSNYSQEENLFLAEKYEEYKEIIDAKHKDSNTNRKKKEAWKTIISQHRARFPGIERTMENLKDRLSKLKSESKECVQQRKRSRIKTGGGKGSPEPTVAQQKILDLCEDSPGFQGLEGVESTAGARDVEDVGSEDGFVFDPPSTENDDKIEEAPTTSKSQASRPTPPPSKKSRDGDNFKDLIDLERENALLKRENLQLEQEKLKLEIELLKKKLDA